MSAIQESAREKKRTSVCDDANAVFREDADALNAYTNLKKIGEGAYGKVYSAVEKRTGKRYAFKACERNPDDEGLPQSVVREISALRQLEHPNIVPLLDVLYGAKNIFLVMEYMDQSMRKVLDDFKDYELPLPHIKHYLRQMASALSFCHTALISHRDLKPENILISNRNKLKLIDFGQAKEISNVTPRAHTLEVATIWYVAPEILLGDKTYDVSADMWSFGCVFVELFTKVPIFKGSDEISQLKKIAEVLGTPDPEIWPNIVDLPLYPKMRIPKLPRLFGQGLFPRLSPSGLSLLRGLLRYDPQTRLTATQTFKNEFLQDFHAQRLPSLAQVLQKLSQRHV